MSTNRTPEFIERDSLSAHPPDGVAVSLPDGIGFTVERRDFLRLSAVAAAAAGIALVGIAALPAAAVVAGAVMLAETELMLRVFGRFLDRLDPGEEGLL